MNEIKLRPMASSDYQNVAAFWENHYELKLHKGDDEATITRLLEKNPNFSTVAIQDGAVVGTCMGAFDGRKGYIQKVAVSEELRGHGLGVKLVKATIEKLKQAGAFQIQVNCGEDLVPFYQKAGFEINPITAMKMKVQK